jgi:hypothetical protein
MSGKSGALHPLPPTRFHGVWRNNFIPFSPDLSHRTAFANEQIFRNWTCFFSQIKWFLGGGGGAAASYRVVTTKYAVGLPETKFYEITRFIFNVHFVKKK